MKERICLKTCVKQVPAHQHSRSLSDSSMGQLLRHPTQAGARIGVHELRVADAVELCVPAAGRDRDIGG